MNRFAPYLLVAIIAQAVTAAAQEPLSAIDWLSDSLATPNVQTENNLPGAVVESAMPSDVSVSGIIGPTLDGVGLLPTSVTGLPNNLWGNSRSVDIVGRLLFDKNDLLPAMRDLLFTILLAELDPPIDSGPDAKLFLARLDVLLSFGALEQARSLLEATENNKPELFRRTFDIALLFHTENQACDTLRATPELSPTFPARVFCLARGGDWDAAALSLETGRALGYLTDFEEILLSHFLDPTIFEGEQLPPLPTRPNPLIFRMLEAIGESIPTNNLPLAFAHADLNSNAGWKSQIEAAERLVRAGSLDPNRLLGLYSERRSAASGGVWDRVSAIQALDQALIKGDSTAISKSLPIAWEEMSNSELEVPFAQLFSERLSAADLTPESKKIAFKASLLSFDYKDGVLVYDTTKDEEEILVSIANGQPGKMYSADPKVAAIQDGFRANGFPVRLQSLTNNNRLGEAILRSISLFNSGQHGDLDDLTDAIAFFRNVGLEDVARKASLQLMLLERRG